MNIAQVSLDIAMHAKPTWNGVGTNTLGTATVVDSLLAKSGEAFGGGTLWALGTAGPTVYKVKSHNNINIILETVSVTAAIVNYIISPISFAELLRAINTALVHEREMKYEEIDIITATTPSRYTLTTAKDIRQVLIVPTDTTIDPTHHHYWREELTEIYFYNNAPSDAGHIRCYYPAMISTKTGPTDTLPANIRYEVFLNNCLQWMLRLGIQKMGKDVPANYDLINEAKDIGDKQTMTGISRAASLMDYDIRYKA
jgi:hypothetical protein